MLLDAISTGALLMGSDELIYRMLWESSPGLYKKSTRQIKIRLLCDSFCFFRSLLLVLSSLDTDLMF